MITIQSVSGSGTTLKNAPPTVTINIWPKNISAAMKRNSPHPLKWSAERRVAYALALNMFQNCRKINTLKKMLISRGLSPLFSEIQGNFPI